MAFVFCVREHIEKGQGKTFSRLLLLIRGRGTGGGLCDRGSGIGFKINTYRRRYIYLYKTVIELAV